MLTKRLKELRSRIHLSQVKMAEKLNVSQGCYASWETGRNEPDVSSLRNICRVGGVSLDWLLGLDKNTSLISEAEFHYLPDGESTEISRLISIVEAQQKTIQTQAEVMKGLMK